ncbi:FAD-dependent oxidoreductase [Candidatus Bipolaricaulota bacterium]|nr:FAD-dependent oxidoreductase [Candidatus Bipolaricaulota bacterium]TFH11180.1 MAG: NAD(P)/FAD-dependent oxidoreductase [Candidatus Atribacteria bacterium]
MRYDYDVGVIGLGPAGMAVSVMASNMGLRVLAIERRALGGECMNVGCIPSKALLQMAHVRHLFTRSSEFALEQVPHIPDPVDPFQTLGRHIQFINDRKTAKMFEKVDLKLGLGSASFVDPHTIAVGDVRHTAKRFFICTGTQPALPPIPGLDSVDVLTNETLFQLDSVPQSLLIIGGGAMGCEMAQAFKRLGSEVTIVHLDSHLLPHGDADAGRMLEDAFTREGIAVYNERNIRQVGVEGDCVVLKTDRNETFHGQRLLVAAGRQHDLSDLALENAGVEYSKAGILVNAHLRTTQRAIYAPGDCNGVFLFSHSAMHQGMIALMNAIAPWPVRFNYTKYVVPWTVFTDPPVAHVGWLERDLQKSGIDYEVHEEKYEDYGAAIAEGLAVGSVRAYVSKMGRIYGVRIIGAGAGEMINEWGLAIQNKMRLSKIMFLQHSFPSMSFLNKRVSERWMMKRMESPSLRSLVRWLY